MPNLQKSSQNSAYKNSRISSRSSRHSVGDLSYSYRSWTSKGIGLLAKLNQTDGFDCPGCAWPDPDEKRAFLAEYCENGAKAVAEEATKNSVSPLFFATHSIQELSALSDYELGKKGRITCPVVLQEGKEHYEEISWEDAFSMILKNSIA